ncbi:TolB-like protein/class 3 adenylate cyclase [Bradyrhizobium diazoefficiens]|uniref:adenylate/guanylate cyclase domain-containing protein n=1 Tax=Bradyrhizobium diazoefficiens TaxID=1355477 RepID=UPI003480A9DB
MEQERPVRLERRLSAIMAADVAGYSRLMHHDEEATHSKLTSLLAEGVAPAISEHGGRIVKNTGDGFLAEFPSAVEAVRAAVQFQTRIRELTAADAEERRIAFRVGINVGDVIVEPHDVFGDGVNIAARLESIADPGGICISSSAYDHIRGKVGIEFANCGEQTFKNIDLPIQTYAALLDGLYPQRPVGAKVPRSPPRLSIVVLPFANLSGDPLQDYFVDGVTESLTTDLSRISGSLVIGRHTAYTYKGKPIDLKQIGRDLDVHYVLEGSVQRSGDRFRVNVQLVDTETGSHLWADRFDKPLADLFEMQDEIVSRLANALNAQLIAAEARRAERSLQPSALDFYFQGMALWNKSWTSPHLRQARSFFERALGLEPDNVEALVGIALVDAAMASVVFADDPCRYFAASEAASMKALSLDPQHALAHMALGVVQVCTQRAVKGVAECERALALNRNLAEAHALFGVAKMLLGHPEEMEGYVRDALRLSPRDDGAHRWLCCVGLAKLCLGAEAEAIEWLRQSIKANPNYPVAHFVSAAVLALIGKMDDAVAAKRDGLALDPAFTIRRLKNVWLSDDPTFRAGSRRLVKGLHMAGVPE